MKRRERLDCILSRVATRKIKNVQGGKREEVKVNNFLSTLVKKGISSLKKIQCNI